MQSKFGERRNPYKVAVLRGSEKSHWEIKESKYLKALANTYRALYQEKGKQFGVGSLQFSVNETSSREKFNRQLTNIRRSPKKPDGIHFMGHSGRTKDKTFIVVGCEEIDLKSEFDQSMFKGIGFSDDLGTGWILFSCCKIGDDAESLKRLAEISGGTVFAFESSENPSDTGGKDTDRLEHQAFIVDSMFYHLMFTPHGYFNSDQDNIPYCDIRDRLKRAIEALAIGTSIYMVEP